MKHIYEFETIKQLKDYISSVSANQLRQSLLNEFNQLIEYKNIKEWNKLVRICEALAITGWADKEPFEALADQGLSGSYYTELRNKFFERKKNSCKGWSRKKETFVIDETDADKTDYGIKKLASQRNELPKTPITWSRSGNYQTFLQPLIDSLKNLQHKFVRETRPELYGDSVSYVGINFCFSYHDDKNINVRQEYFHDENDVPNNLKDSKKPFSNGLSYYYIRPRLEIGKLSTKNNRLRLIVTRYFTRAFGELALAKQKKILETDFLEIIDILAGKLQKKKIKYNTELLKQDTIKIFSEW
jgi:hypothetical protein